MSIFSPGLVLYDFEPTPKTTTPEERAEYKSRRRSARLRALVERLDEIVTKNRKAV